MVRFTCPTARLEGLNSPTATAGMSDGRLWIKTPLIRSSALSERLGTEVYLKIEVSGISARRLISTDLVGLWQTFQKGRSFKVRLRQYLSDSRSSKS